MITIPMHQIAAFWAKQDADRIQQLRDELAKTIHQLRKMQAADIERQIRAELDNAK